MSCIPRRDARRDVTRHGRQNPDRITTCERAPSTKPMMIEISGRSMSSSSSVRRRWYATVSNASLVMFRPVCAADSGLPS
jgi:hypothetical protein